MKIPVDSPLIMKNSRHSITEAGLDTIVENLRKSSAGGRSSNCRLGQARLQGAEKPAGLDRPATISCAGRLRAKPGTSTSTRGRCCPDGCRRGFAQGELIERYVYHEIRENPTELAAAGAFEPDERWGEPKGLFSPVRASRGGYEPARLRRTRRRADCQSDAQTGFCCRDSPPADLIRRKL